MSYKINSDLNRFKDIIRNKVKNNLRKYASSDNILGQQGKKIISVPVDRMDLPRFIFGNSKGGVGQGDGNEGDPVGGDPQQGEGKGKAGKDSGEHGYLAEFSPEELAQILGEELQLPKLENKGKGPVHSVKDRYTGIRNQGPEGLKLFKRTYKETLKRAITSGDYDPHNPILIPIKDDKRFKAQNEKEEPDVNTVVIYMMDVSGSMGYEERHIVKSEVFWIDLWLKSQYKNIESRFIVHDIKAEEVSRDKFFTIEKAGGTMISSAFEFCADMIEKEYPFSSWNVYPFHFSDGDTYTSDSERCGDILKNKLLPNCNVFSYGQVAYNYQDSFINYLSRFFLEDERVTVSLVDDRSKILDSIKAFFGKGK